MTETKMIYSLQDKEIKKSDLNFFHANSKGSICIVCYSASLACLCIHLWEVVKENAEKTQ